MHFFASQEFHNEYKKLKKKKAHYHCVAHSLFLEFHNKSDEEIKARGNFLSNSSSSTVIKKKRANSCGNNGKSYGFRILAVVNIESGICGLFMIYPKWGPLAKNNVLKEEWRPRLESYIDEKNNGVLLKMKFDKKNEEVYLEKIS